MSSRVDQRKGTAESTSGEGGDRRSEAAGSLLRMRWWHIDIGSEEAGRCRLGFVWCVSIHQSDLSLLSDKLSTL